MKLLRFLRTHPLYVWGIGLVTLAFYCLCSLQLPGVYGQQVFYIPTISWLTWLLMSIIIGSFAAGIFLRVAKTRRLIEGCLFTFTAIGILISSFILFAPAIRGGIRHIDSARFRGQVYQLAHTPIYHSSMYFTYVLYQCDATGLFGDILTRDIYGNGISSHGKFVLFALQTTDDALLVIDPSNGAILYRYLPAGDS